MKDYLCKLLDISMLKLSWNNLKTTEVPFEKFEKTKYTFSIIHLNRTPVAQLVERRAETREVVRSTPAGPSLRVLK